MYVHAYGQQYVRNPGVKGCVKRRRAVQCVAASTFLCLYSSFELVVLLYTVCFLVLSLLDTVMKVF